MNLPGTHAPWRATTTISSSPACREGRGEGVGSGERPPSGRFPKELEGGLGDKPRGIKARAGSSGERAGMVLVCLGRWRSRSQSRWFVGACSRWRFGLVSESGAWSLQSVESPGVAKETRTGGAALPAVSRKPARSCGESRRELAGRLARPELNRGYSSCRGDGTSRLTPQGTTRVQVTCTVSWDSFGLPSPAP